MATVTQAAGAAVAPQLQERAASKEAGAGEAHRNLLYLLCPAPPCLTVGSRQGSRYRWDLNGLPCLKAWQRATQQCRWGSRGLHLPALPVGVAGSHEGGAGGYIAEWRIKGSLVLWPSSRHSMGAMLTAASSAQRSLPRLSVRGLVGLPCPALGTRQRPR